MTAQHLLPSDRCRYYILTYREGLLTERLVELCLREDDEWRDVTYNSAGVLGQLCQGGESSNAGVVSQLLGQKGEFRSATGVASQLCQGGENQRKTT